MLLILTMFGVSELVGFEDSGRWKPDGYKGECGKSITHQDRTGRVVGGRKAKLGQFPWMVLIGYDPSSVEGDDIFYLCAGSLINKHYVLTSAGCIDTENGDPVEVVLGDLVVGEDPDCDSGSCNAPVIKRRVTKSDITVHENYDKENLFINDIALIRLDEAVPLFQDDQTKSSVVPVCLPWAEDSYPYSVKDGDIATVAGWGRTTRRLTKNNSNYFLKHKVNKKHLQVADLPISNEKCNKDSFAINKSLQLCAGGEKGIDSCSGDRGGPLVAQKSSSDPWYEIGITSFGTTRCASEIPGVYTKVTGYMQWIDDNLKE